ncbi:MAG: leucine-rich repeat domain-containing protein [Paludibacteraceae bacterium]
MEKTNQTLSGNKVTQSNLQDFFEIKWGSNYTYHSLTYKKVDKEQITSINIPDGTIQAIEKDAFNDFDNLQSITFPKDLNTIQRYTFGRNCGNLTSITWNALNFGQTGSGMPHEPSEEGPFHDIAPQITSFTFGYGIETIPHRLLAGMINLSSINIPDSVTTIEQEAFRNCKRLEEIVLSANIREIEEQAFAGCQNIYKIVCYATKVPCITGDTFYGVSPRVKLYVPQESVEKYQIHPYWGQFNVLPIPEIDTILLPIVPTGQPLRSYTIDGKNVGYSYYPTITPLLDNIEGPFTMDTIYRLTLWKVSRYPEIAGEDSEFFDKLNLLADYNTLKEAKNLASEVLRILLSESTKGVRLPMASTYLRFRNPKVFQIIDQRVWRQVRLFKGEADNTDLKLPSDIEKQIDLYFEYLEDLRQLSKAKNIPFCEADRAFYAYDIALGYTILY